MKEKKITLGQWLELVEQIKRWELRQNFGYNADLDGFHVRLQHCLHYDDYHPHSYSFCVWGGVGEERVYLANYKYSDSFKSEKVLGEVRTLYEKVQDLYFAQEKGKQEREEIAKEKRVKNATERMLRRIKKRKAKIK